MFTYPALPLDHTLRGLKESTLCGGLSWVFLVQSLLREFEVRLPSRDVLTWAERSLSKWLTHLLDKLLLAVGGRAWLFAT
jgi:hypothetical protein